MEDAGSDAELTPDGIRDRAVLLDLACAMVAGGARVDDVEAQLGRVGHAVGYPDLRIAASPTGVFLALAPGGAVSFSPAGAGLRLDQTAQVNEMRLDLLAGRTRLFDVVDRLHDVRHLGHRYGAWGPYVGLALVATGICSILQPGPANVLAAGLCSVLVPLLMQVTGRHPTPRALLPLAASFLVSLVMLGAAHAGLLEGPLRTLICPLAVLLPGGLLSAGVAELAAGAMVAGTARLVSGLVQLVLFALGVLAAASVWHDKALDNVRVHDLGLWSAPVGLAAITVGIALSESLPWRLVRWMAPILVATYLTQLVAQQLTRSTAIGAFAGAVVASLLAGLVEIVWPTVPALVAFLPSFWLLVPGTVGLLGITEISTGAGSGAAVGVVAVVAAIAMGILVGTTVALSVGSLRARATRRRPFLYRT